MDDRTGQDRPDKLETSLLLALDFDGVVCNGLAEYFQTAWKAYCQIVDLSHRTPPDDLAPSFYRLRPVIETGWEMPVLLHARLHGVGEGEILENWHDICQKFVQREGWSAARLAEAVDGTRDLWIDRDLEGWLTLHEFYPGTIDRLRRWQSDGISWVVITTKEGRFVRSLLQREGITLSEGQLFGKEVKRPKHQILRELGAARRPVVFVEDRLKTLESVASQPDLTSVRLYLADWGYNTESMRQTAREIDRIQLLSLPQFCEDLSNWS
ncbi:MAG: HAD family hydrolase [Cyanobacteria bacterium SID2]|nr:HAD family hydrolase [Cyanobacteria bacterium SID2]MBP0002757.1 HAD family hydrolase [Cyanobacteria bacterium SBC]